MRGQNAIEVELEKVADSIFKVPATRRYWLIRTQGGLYYEEFRKDNFVALGHRSISMAEINKIIHRYKSDVPQIRTALRLHAESKFKNKRNAGLIAGQLFRFVFSLKKDDLVVIPTENSEGIAIGKVTSDEVLDVKSEALVSCPYDKRKSIKWVKTLSREALDLGLYKALGTHQAISDISKYSDSIERAVGSLYVKDDIANLILEINQELGINAKELFGLGYNLLNYSEGFSSANNLNLAMDAIEVKINLNSRGKIHLKAPDTKTIFMVAVLVLFINGGGLKFTTKGGLDFDLSTDGVIKNVIDYQNNEHDRKMKDSLQHAMNSLQLKNPEDAVKLLQQLSSNKNNPK